MSPKEYTFLAFDRAFYSAFWTALREGHPDLPCHNGYHLAPEELGRNYLGTRIVRPDGTRFYVHMKFTDLGETRRIAVELYAELAGQPGWAALTIAAAKAAPRLEPVPLPVRAGAKAVRSAFLVRGPRSSERVQIEREAIIVDLVAAYSALLQLPGN
jgi:hypothetical protein